MARKATAKTGVEQVLAETQRLVTRLVAENRTLKTRNTRLAAELARISKGWEQIRALAKQAPRKRRS